MNSLALASSLSVLNSVSNVNAINTLSIREKNKNDKMLTPQLSKEDVLVTNCQIF